MRAVFFHIRKRAKAKFFRRNFIDRVKEPTALVHIGMHKTGSSVIQSTLSQVGAENFRYADLGTSNHSGPIRMAFDSEPNLYHGNFLMGRSLEECASFKSYYRARAKEELERKDRIIVLSGEDMSLLAQSDAGEFVSFVNGLRRRVVMVMVVRNPMHFALSQLQQRIKGAKCAREVETAAPDFRERAQVFINKLEKNSSLLLKYEDLVRPRISPSYIAEKNTSSLVNNFSRLTGLRIPRSDYGMENTSVSMSALKLLFLHNQLIEQPRSQTEIDSKQQMVDLLRQIYPGRVDVRDFPPGMLVPLMGDLELLGRDLTWLRKHYGISYKTGSAYKPKGYTLWDLEQFLRDTTSIDPNPMRMSSSNRNLSSKLKTELDSLLEATLLLSGLPKSTP